MSSRRNSQPTKTWNPAPHRPNTKQTGERSEASFLHKASHLGFGVAKPWGDSLRYDFVLDNGERLWRIQVKCTECLRAQAYEARATYSVGKGRAVYTRADTDFLAVHVVPLDIWYIVPVEICTPQPMLRFYPHRQAQKNAPRKIPRSLAPTPIQLGPHPDRNPRERRRNLLQPNLADSPPKEMAPPLANVKERRFSPAPSVEAHPSASREA